MSEKDAMNRTNYYRAEYDEEGRLAHFEQVWNNEVVWADDYKYAANGRLRRRIMRKSDGSELVEEYDRRGKLVR